jgi:hypothetical protein
MDVVMEYPQYQLLRQGHLHSHAFELNFPRDAGKTQFGLVSSEGEEYLVAIHLHPEQGKFQRLLLLFRSFVYLAVSFYLI